MKTILLRDGFSTIVDDGDYDYIISSPYRWTTSKGRSTYYVIGLNQGKICVKLHRYIMQAPSGVLIDHIDGNGLNNIRSNLRFATNSQNQINSKIHSSNTSGYRGVVYEASRDKFRAQLHVNYRKIHIGYFDDAEEAKEAYDKMAQEIFGEFVRLEGDMEKAQDAANL